MCCSEKHCAWWRAPPVQSSSAVICGREMRKYLYYWDSLQCCASCPVPFCGKRDEGHCKGFQFGTHYPTAHSSVRRTVSVSYDIFSLAKVKICHSGGLIPKYRTCCSVLWEHTSILLCVCVCVCFFILCFNGFHKQGVPDRSIVSSPLICLLSSMSGKLYFSFKSLVTFHVLLA